MKRIGKLTGYAAALLHRGALLAVLWWLLAEGRIESPALALTLVCAAAAGSLALAPSSRARWRATRLPALFFYMLRMSIAGGWDVARRALLPGRTVEPGVVRYELRLGTGVPAVLYTWLVSLAPGIASVRLDGPVLLVHALDVRQDVQRNLAGLEDYVADLFAEE